MYQLIHFYFIASLLFFLMVGAGLLLLIVPGVILSLVFWFYGYALVDKRLGPIAALKEGARISRGARLEFFLFLFIFFLTNFALIVGWMFLIIPLVSLLGFFGIIIALVAPIIFFVFLFPFFGLIQAHIYVKLRDSELLPQ